MSGRVYVALLNWRSWGDTIECLESVFRNDYPDFRVIVCDNNSGDRSLEYMTAWAAGNLDAATPAGASLRALTHPPHPKPIKYVYYGRAEAEAGGRTDDADPPLIFIQTEANLGFAAGMNVALRYAMARGDFDYFWLLNMDTVVPKNALSALVRRMEEYPKAGQCGSTLLDYKPPHEVQCLGGGSFNKWLIRTQHFLKTPADGKQEPRQAIEARLDFVFGASLLARKSFIEETGLLSEDYFLWNEEIDWSLRGGAKFKLAFAPDSVVYHKFGVTTDPHEQKYRSRISDLCYQENKLTLAARHYPWSIPVVYGGYLVAMVKRALNGDWDRVTMIAGIMLRGLVGKIGNAERFRK